MSFDISVSDPAEFAPLRAWLAHAPDVRVLQTAGTTGHGEQGAWDALTVLASGTGLLAVAIRSLPEFIRSRRSTITLTVTAGGREITVDAENVEEVMPLLEAAVRDVPVERSAD